MARALFPPGEILVVDDSSAMRTLLRRVLQTEFKGWVIREMENGLDALQQKEYLLKLSLVITDMEMPGMDGKAFLERLQEDPLLKEKPVIMLSGGDFQGLKETHMDSKIIKFLEKPCGVGEIIAAARLLLAGSVPP